MLPGRTYSIEDILAILWRRKWLITIPFALCTAVTYSVATRLPDLFRSETVILVVPQKVPESYVHSTVSGRIEDRLQSLQQQILSRSRLERIILDFDLYRDARRAQPMEAVIESMRSAIKVDTQRGGEAFSVSYVAREAETAQRVTERLASLFIDENVRDREMLANGTSDFLQTQLDDARKRLIEQERKLQQYRLEHAGDLPSQAPVNLQALQNARLQQQALDDALARAGDRQALLERGIAALYDTAAPAPASAPLAAPENPDEPVGATLREQVMDGRRKLAAMETRLKPGHPDVQRLRARVQRLEGELSQETAAPPAPAAPRTPVALDPVREARARELRTDLETVKREIADRQADQRKLAGEMALYQSHLDAAPIREAELTELTRDYDTIQQIYRELLAKREDSKIAANLEQRQIGEQFRVLDPARVPERPFSPNRARINLLGVLGGLFVGLGLAVLLEYLDDTLKTEADVRLILKLPVIATIPLLQAAPAAVRRRPNSGWRFGFGMAPLARIVWRFKG